ncbi:MAG: hypothetical protein ABIJ09_10980 [Pseudomonadota bacterium]
MLFTEPRVAATRKPLGRFTSFEAQDRADLAYGGQDALLAKLGKKSAEKRPADVIPTPATPPSR